MQVMGKLNLVGLGVFFTFSLAQAQNAAPIKSIKPEASPRPVNTQSTQGQLKKKVPTIQPSENVKTLSPPVNPDAGSHGEMDLSAGPQMGVGVQIPLSKKKNAPQAEPGSPEAEQTKEKK
jgi:hypothetical protein